MKIKQLVWTDDAVSPGQHAFGVGETQYRVQFLQVHQRPYPAYKFVRWVRGVTWGQYYHGTIDEAKSACQDHYESEVKDFCKDHLIEPMLPTRERQAECERARERAESDAFMEGMNG